MDCSAPVARPARISGILRPDAILSSYQSYSACCGVATIASRFGVPPFYSSFSHVPFKHKRQALDLTGRCPRPRLCYCEATTKSILTVPTLLTLGRVVAVPALAVAWFGQQWALCAGLFVVASLTDFLDGYLARKMNAFSAFGAFLDPVADKLMVSTVLILLGTLPFPSRPLLGNTWVLPLLACVIIGREIAMSALREWASALGPEAHSAVAVSPLGKWKTATQMVSLTTLLASRIRLLPANVGETLATIGLPLLVLAAFFTIAFAVKPYVGRRGVHVGRGKYNKRGRGRGGGGRRGRESSWKDGSDDTSSEEEVVYHQQASTVGLLPPSSSEEEDSGEEEKDAVGHQNPRVGELPPGDSDDDDDEEDDEKKKRTAKTDKKVHFAKQVAMAEPRSRRKDDVDEDQLAADMERLALIRKKREEQRLARIAEEGWDRFAPISETNKPPGGIPSDYARRATDDNSDN